MLIVSLLVASFVIFAAIYLAPGNPIAALSGGRSIPPESLKVLEARYHLDQPFLVQYWYWLTNALHGNLYEFVRNSALEASVMPVVNEAIFDTPVIA